MVVFHVVIVSISRSNVYDDTTVQGSNRRGASVGHTKAKIKLPVISRKQLVTAVKLRVVHSKLVAFFSSKLNSLIQIFNVVVVLHGLLKSSYTRRSYPSLLFPAVQLVGYCC